MSIESHSTLQELVGRDLTAVNFLHDYLILHFDGPSLNVMNTLVVTSAAHTSTSGDDSFRNLICSQISKCVQTVRLTRIELAIQFVDECRISVMLEEQHYSGPEAVYYYGFDQQAWGVIRPHFD